MESEACNEGLKWECDKFDVLTIVRQVYKTPYLNRLKQFFLRLIRNNLYIGKSTRGSNNSKSQDCIICGKHPEKHIPMLFSFDIVKQLTSQLINTLREASLLEKGSNIEICLFKEYYFNSIENLTLVNLWDYIYKACFNPEKYSACKFNKYLQYQVDCFTLIAPRLKLGFWMISNVLKRNSYHNSDI